MFWKRRCAGDSAAMNMTINIALILLLEVLRGG